MAEAFGIKGRGAFYEDVGAIRDVVQNHMLQVLALLAMDPPSSLAHAAIGDEKLRLFRTLQTLAPADVVRGQFQGYRGQAGVAAQSTVETFAALRIAIDNWRWQGVPFYIRAGKKMPVTCTEVLVRLHHPPQQIFPDEPPNHTNSMRFRLSPDVVLAQRARVKRAGEAMVGTDVELIAQGDTHDDMLPYERLLGDAIDGDAALFTRGDCVEEAWRVVNPVLNDEAGLYPYQPGTWGPDKSAALIQNGCWHDPIMED